MPKPSTNNPPEEPEDLLRRALEYPYFWPGSCYLYHGGDMHPVDNREARREGRTPVLAYGSNRSPHQLRRKFGDLDNRDAILVERCEIGGWDVVHSAHVTSYGAIPAALHRHEGVSVTVAVTWLSARQVAQMDVSESAGRNYGREHLGCRAVLGSGDTSDAVEAYLTGHGVLEVSNRIASHADIEARGRPHPALRNIDVLMHAHRKFSADTDFESFVIRLATDARFRDEITDRLKAGL